jgi:hypothetical protein
MAGGLKQMDIQELTAQVERISQRYASRFGQGMSSWTAVFSPAIAAR